MLRTILYRDIFLVPILCGLFIQCIKFVIYLLEERRVNIGTLVQTDGMPNLHSAVFSSLSAAIGIKYGFSSILFSLVTVYSVIIIHDTMRLKGEKGKQAGVLKKIIASVDSYKDIADENALRVLNFRPLDVLAGTVLGVIGAYVLL
jgi:acid phosphatase family membrane protein YuiD